MENNNKNTNIFDEERELLQEQKNTLFEIVRLNARIKKIALRLAEIEQLKNPVIVEENFHTR